MSTAQGVFMKKYLILLCMGTLSLLAQESVVVPQKKCEVIKLSNFNTLVSCHNFDYLIEYQETRRDDEDSVKKITAISLKETKIIKTQ